MGNNANQNTETAAPAPTKVILKEVTLKGTAVIEGKIYRKGDKAKVTVEKQAELKELSLI